MRISRGESGGKGQHHNNKRRGVVLQRYLHSFCYCYAALLVILMLLMSNEEGEGEDGGKI